MPELTFIEEGHQYFLDGVPLPSVTQVLFQEGFIDDRWWTEYACLRGTYVHKACQLENAGTLDEDALDPAIKGYHSGYVAFLRDTGFRPVEWEMPKYHPTYLYAGTPDVRGILYGQRAKIDLKSGKPEPWVKLQLGGYYLLNEPEDCYSLQLKPDGTYNLSEKIKDIRQHSQVFLAALACHNWKLNNRR